MDLSNITVEKELQIVFMGTPDFAVPVLECLIENYKVRIKNEEWLSDDTKAKALAKMEKMTYTVGIPEEFVKVENNYDIT